MFATMLKDSGTLNIVTDAVNISYELSSYPNIHLISLGGEIRHNSLTTTGQIAESNLNSFQLDCMISFCVKPYNEISNSSLYEFMEKDKDGSSIHNVFSTLQDIICRHYSCQYSF